MKTFQMDSQALVALVHEAAAIVLSWALALALLRNGTFPAVGEAVRLALVVAIPLQALVTYLFGVYQGIWRYTSLPDVQRIIFAVVAGTVAVSGALHVVGLGGALGYREYVPPAIAAELYKALGPELRWFLRPRIGWESREFYDYNDAGNPQEQVGL